MGWIESLPYFCASSETGRDVTEVYMETPLGTLMDNKLIKWATDSDDFRALPLRDAENAGLRYIVEVYMDDYLGLAIPATRHHLRHTANAVMHGINDVFPPDAEDYKDPISPKKMQKGEGTWALQKDILGFTFSGTNTTLWLEAPKRESLLTILHQWLRASRATNAGVPFEEFKSVVAKV
jgi:hypothetical protein